MRTKPYYLNDEQRLDWLQLIRSENIGPARFHQLINRFGGARSAIEALPQFLKLKKIRNINIASRSSVEREFELSLKYGAKLIALGEKDYPPLLKLSDNPPPILTAFGDITQLTRPSLSIVGTRNCSSLGLKLCEKLASFAADHNFTISSGFAKGIDGRAHLASLKLGTIACLAGGVNVIYPKQHQKLYDQMINNKGVFLSDMPFDLQPMAKHFPKRNQIIAALSPATLVIEAAIKSGSLITANMAANLGRDVLAVPGNPLDPRAAGPNSLIKDHAIMIRHETDLLDYLSQINIEQYEPKPKSKIVNKAEAQTKSQVEEKSPNTPKNENEIILDLLSTSPTHLDFIIRESGLTAVKVQRILFELEMTDQIEHVYGQGVCLKV